MTNSKRKQIEYLIEKIPDLKAGQLYWLDKVIQVFESPYSFQVLEEEFFDKKALEYFGDALRIHHCFSKEPFSKDKFEYVLDSVLRLSGWVTELAPKGNSGHDITVNGIAVSLKTQANKAIQKDKIWISKLMELGKGRWGDNPKDLIDLRKAFFKHMDHYDRIFVLRALSHSPEWHYELVEIPKELLFLSRDGHLEMKLESKQFPRPGYCYVRTDDNKDIFQLYFDGGTERKLQLKNLLKSYCILHATWEFSMPSD